MWQILRMLSTQATCTALIILPSLLQTAVLQQSSSPCPNQKFCHDHVCPLCLTEEVTLKFCENRYKPAGINTVLVPHVRDAMQYWVQSVDERVSTTAEDLCVAQPEMDLVWQCNMQTSQCKVKHRKKKCLIHHSLATGHFFYNKMSCS